VAQTLADQRIVRGRVAPATRPHDRHGRRRSDFHRRVIRREQTAQRTFPCVRIDPGLRRAGAGGRRADDFCAIGWHLLQLTTKISPESAALQTRSRSAPCASKAVTNVTIVPDLTPAQNRWLRVAAAVLAVGLTGGAVLAAALWSGSAAPSAGVLAASVLSGVAAAGCLGLAVGPARWQQPLLQARDRFAPRLLAGPLSVSQRSVLALTCVGALSFALIVARLLSSPQDPWDDDQGAFLITAREIQDQGGIAWLWAALWSGQFGEANRHPLYLALLSLHPTVRFGEWLSAGIGALTLLLLTACTARRLGGATAAVACILLGTNAAFCLYSTRVVCEILLMLLCGLTWLLHVRSPRSAAASVISAQNTAVGGALLGLAWLTKGTGLVFFGGYLLWLALAGLQSVWQKKRNKATSEASAQGLAFRTAVLSATCALIAFLLVGSPLIARNLHRFGNAFHNLNSLLLFADRYEDLPIMVDRGLTTGAAAQEFWQTHSLADIARREAGGLIWEAFIIVRSLGPAPLDDSRVLFGLPLALLAAAGMAVRRDPADGLLLIWGLICWGMFAWYVPIAAGERFILPLLGPVLIAASRDLASLATTAESRRRWVWAGGAICWSIVSVLACWLTDGFVDRTG